MRYFFHLKAENRFVADLEGVELDGLEAVRREAADGARDMVANGLRAARRIDLDTASEIEDESGRLVHRVSFRDALDVWLGFTKAQSAKPDAV